MSYFIFTNNLDNVEETIYKIAENQSDLNNLNIEKSSYNEPAGGAAALRQALRRPGGFGRTARSACPSGCGADDRPAVARRNPYPAGTAANVYGRRT